MTISIHIFIEDARADTLAALLAGLARSDGRPSGDETNVPAPVQETAAQGTAKPGLSVENLVAFLKSDDRYTLRTLESIAKHFGVQTYDTTLEDVLNVAVEDGDVYTKRRRSDDVTLYGAH